MSMFTLSKEPKVVKRYVSERERRTMKKTIALVLGAATLASPAIAKPVDLVCTADRGEPHVLVDEEKGRVNFIGVDGKSIDDISATITEDTVSFKFISPVGEGSGHFEYTINRSTGATNINVSVHMRNGFISNNTFSATCR
jgi:hypothetical protein